jgi:hypothetical protein
LISGQTQLESTNGSAPFEALKLRAPAGLHPLLFNASTPIRNLAPALVRGDFRAGHSPDQLLQHASGLCRMSSPGDPKMTHNACCNTVPPSSYTCLTMTTLPAGTATFFVQTVVEVRSCMVGEFLVPTGDQCLPCDAGTFNTGERCSEWVSGYCGWRPNLECTTLSTASWSA